VSGLFSALCVLRAASLQSAGVLSIAHTVSDTVVRGRRGNGADQLEPETEAAHAPWHTIVPQWLERLLGQEDQTIDP
jgi:hypothetical protein